MRALFTNYWVMHANYDQPIKSPCLCTGLLRTHRNRKKNIRVCVCRLSDYIQLYVAQSYTVEVTVICNMFDLDTTAIKLLNICHSSIINANLI